MPLAEVPVSPIISPTPTAEAIPTQTCLIGQWEVDHLEESLATSYMQTESSLRFDSVEGMTQYVFDSNGAMTINFDTLVIQFVGEIEGNQVVARNTMVGEATAVYRYDESLREVVLSQFGGDGIEFILEINGQVLANGNFPAWRAFASNLNGSSATLPSTGPTRVVNESHAMVNCQGDLLTLQAIDPLPGPEVNLKRVP